MMNWDAISAVGEVLGALAVLVTLLYLALQIREQTKEARLAATRELARDWANSLMALSGDEKRFDLYMRAISDYGNLTGGDRVKAYWMFSTAMRAVELQYFHLSENQFDPAQFSGTEYRIREIAEFPGIREWWNDNKKQFSPGFIDYVEQTSSICESAR